MKGYVTRKRLERETGQVEGNAAIPIMLVGVDHGKERQISWEDGMLLVSLRFSSIYSFLSH